MTVFSQTHLAYPMLQPFMLAAVAERLQVGDAHLPVQHQLIQDASVHEKLMVAQAALQVWLLSLSV